MRPLGAWALPLAWIYGALSLLWRRANSLGGPKRLPGQRCVSVGNLSSGGSGKTPVVALIAKFWQARGLNCAVLTRGYRGLSIERPVRVSSPYELLTRWPQAGDEAELLARQLPGVPVLADPDRRLSAQKAHDTWGCTHWVLDDGFQRRFEVARDLDLLMVHTSDLRPLERVIPAGRLREPWSQGAQASAYIISGPRMGLEDGAWENLLPKPLRGKPVFHLRVTPTRVRHVEGSVQAAQTLQGQAVLALSALGRPEGFEASLAGLGVRLRSQRFEDHHAFTEAELLPLIQGLSVGERIVISAKDAVKWPSGLKGDWGPWILEIEARIEPVAEFEALLEGKAS